MTTTKNSDAIKPFVKHSLRCRVRRFRFADQCICGANKAFIALQELEKLVNTPELYDFAKGVHLEAIHQINRWGSEHDAGKSHEDWFWLMGYLIGKALHAADRMQADAEEGDHKKYQEKFLHHCITAAAVLNNWHARVLGVNLLMRPGLSEEKTRETDSIEQRMFSIECKCVGYAHHTHYRGIPGCRFNTDGTLRSPEEKHDRLCY